LCGCCVDVGCVDVGCVDVGGVGVGSVGVVFGKINSGNRTAVCFIYANYEHSFLVDNF